MKNKIPTYLKKLLKEHPVVKHGRKNYFDAHKRVEKNLKLTKEYIKTIKKN